MYFFSFRNMSWWIFLKNIIPLSWKLLWNKPKQLLQHWWVIHIFGMESRYAHWGRAVLKKAFWRTEWTRGTGEELLVHATRFQRHSVQKTGFWCTEWKFGAKKPLSGTGGIFSARILFSIMLYQFLTNLSWKELSRIFLGVRCKTAERRPGCLQRWAHNAITEEISTYSIKYLTFFVSSGVS